MKTRHAGIAGLLITLVAAALMAQAPDAPTRLAFEVAAIKRSASLDSGGSAGF